MEDQTRVDESGRVRLEPMREYVDSAPGLLDTLDYKLDRFAKSLDVLEARLAPVLNRHAVRAASDPVDPATADSALRERLDRLEQLLGSLDRITSEIDL